MKKTLVLFVLTLSTYCSMALPSYDPFADATASGGTAYAPGAILSGQTNANLETWVALNSTGTGQSVIITNSNLSYPGLPASSGRALLVNSVASGAIGVGGRFTFAGAAGITSGNVYFSFLMRATDISAVNTTASPNGNFWCGFNNSTAGQTTTAGNAPLKVIVKRNGTDSTKYFLGVGKSGTTYANAGFETGTGHSTSETLFVVGRITVNPGGSDDTVALWVNPSASNFGAPSEPTPTSTCSDSSVTDFPVASFIVETRAAANMANVLMDEVRLGTTWASVAPAVAPTAGNTTDPSPATQSVGVGVSATFTAASTATTPSYQWRKAGVKLTDGANISGSTTTSLTIISPQSGDSDSYTLVVTNNAGTYTTGNGVLNVQTPPVVTGPSSQSANAGNQAVLTATVTGGTPITYQWTKGGVNLTNGGNITGATSTALTILAAYAADAGTYNLKATNSISDTIGTDATLTVVDPYISVPPVSQSINAGSGVTFSVTAAGTAPVTYQWINAGGPIASATGSSYSIGSVSDANAGTYAVAVTNGLGTGLVTAPATLTVVDAPVITDPAPNTLTVGLGTNAIFSSSLTSGTSPTYQWYHGAALLTGAHYAGATSLSLTILGAADADAGSYHLVASNSAGSPTSGDAALVVIDPPAITTQPHDAAVLAGGTTNFTVVATPPGGVTYQWQKDSSNITDDSHFTGTTSSSLIIANASDLQAGTYRVVITNFAGTITSSDAHLTVAAAPVVTSDLTNQTVNASSNVIFHVTVTGAAPLTYQWNLATATSTNSLTNGVGSVIAGATNDTLTIGPTFAADQGSYFVIITNSAGLTPSSNSVLTVIDPWISSQPSSLTIGSGTNAVFSVTAVGTPASITYRWKKGAANLTDGGNITGATASTLTVTGVSQSDAASYSVVVTGLSASPTSTAAILTVIDPPVISPDPVSVAKNAGDTATFSAGVTGTSPAYQWQKGGVNLTNGGSITGSTTTALTITGVLAADVGSYTLIASNLAGTATSGFATLSVVDPVITAQPVASQTRASGTNAAFTVTAAGTPTLSYQWRKAGVNLTNGAGISGSTTTKLSLSGLTTASSDTYDVVVTNGVAGTATSTPSVLVVKDTPVIGTQPLGAIKFTGQSYTPTVTATGSDLTYQWFQNSVAMIDGGRVAGSTTSTLTITNLALSDASTFYVIITNLVGTATSSTVGLTVFTPFPTYDPFNYAAPGGVLATNIAPNSLAWSSVGTNNAGTEILTTNINLSYPGLPASTGNAIFLVSGGANRSARLKFGPNVSSGAVYYSCLMRVDNLGSLTAGGVFIGGFNNSMGAQAAQPTVIASRIYLRTTAGGYNIGTAKNDSTAANFAWDPRVFTTNDTVFLVADYEFSGNANNTDVCKMWINPNPASFGAGSPPAPSVTAAVGTDISANVVSFCPQQRAATQPALTVLDEVRVSLNWADVTPPGPVSITSSVAAQTNAFGSNAVISVGVVGGGALTYAWDKNGSALSDGGRISGSTNANLTISNLALDDAGTYRLIVTGPVGAATNTTVLYVSPGITNQPVGQSAECGDAVSLSVSAVGNGTLHYHWYDGASPVGSDSSSLPLNPAHVGDSGSYTVVVNDEYGSITSAVAVVSVTDTQGPVIHITGSNPAQVSRGEAYSDAGATATDACAGSETVDHSGTVDTNAPGNYTITYTSTDGTTASTNYRTVVVSSGAPVITSQPASVSVDKGQTATFSVGVSGTGPFSYQWFTRNNAAPNASAKISGATTNTYSTVVNTAPTKGWYVVVSNAFGVVTSDVAQVTFWVPPTISTQPGHFKVIAGNNVTFTVKAAGSVPFSYQWKKNGSILGGQTGTALALINVQEVGTTNYYSCVVTNGGGSVESDTNTSLHGQLIVLADTNKPTVAISYPASGARLTNGQSYTFNGATAIAPLFHLIGTASDMGLLTNVTIQRTFPTLDAPIAAVVNQTAPGKLSFTNLLTFEDGTNTYVVRSFDSAGNSNSVTRTFFYVNNTTMLHLTNNGSGTTIPVGSASTFTKYGTPTNGAILEIGRTYTIQAVPDANNIFTNWTDAGMHPLSSSNKLTFTMSSNLVIYANFATNPIVAAHVDGTYNGLFYETNGSGNPDIKLATAGSVTSVKVGTNGVFSGKLNLQGVGNTLSGTFDKDGNFSKAISRAAQGRSTLNVTLHLDWVGATKQITGTVDSAPLLADLASITNEVPARYTLSIPSADTTGLTAPGGSSYATITNGPAGTIGLTGKTADGVSLSQKAAISKDGNMPLSIQLYGKLGLLEGWLHFTPTTVSGAVTWIKPATNNPATYASGFTNDSIAFGTVYTNKTPALAATNLTLTLTDCDGLTTNATGAQLSWNVWLKGNSIIVSTNSNNPTNKISGSVAASTGVLSLSYYTTAGGVKKTLTGVVNQGDNTGAGYLIGTNHVGGFSLTPVGP